MDFNSIKKISKWRFPLIDSYITNQLSLFFLFSVGLLSCLGVSIGTVSDLASKITDYGLPIPVAILIFIYKIPEYVAYALPISILLSCLVIYGRLSSDCELVALLSFGINFYRITIPALLFSLIVTGITFLLNELIVPAANYQANLLQSDYITETELSRQKRDVFYPEYKSNLHNSASKKLQNIYFAEQYINQSFKKVTIISFEQGKISQITTAKLAQWNQSGQVWDLFDGEINKVGDSAEEMKTERFTYKQLPFSANVFEIAKKKRNFEDMNIQQAKEYLDLIKDSGAIVDVSKLKVSIQQKYAFPFICFVFALIGSTLGAKYSYLNRSKGFGICVAIVFVYYLLAFVLGSLGITGILSPFWAAWTPNLLGLGMGGWLLIAVNN